VLVWPILCGVLFFQGQILTFRAIAAGDVSVSTPLMGTKILFVALFTVLIARTPLPGSWWWACLMASSGIALISYDRSGLHRGIRAAVLWTLAAAAVYALTDLLVQLGVPRVGYSRFAPVMFGTTGVLSLLYLPGTSRSLHARNGDKKHPGDGASPWLLAGAVVLAIQSLAMLLRHRALRECDPHQHPLRFPLSLERSSCLVTSRAHPGGADGASHRIMGRRLIGAILLVTAMALVRWRTLGAGMGRPMKTLFPDPAVLPVIPDDEIARCLDLLLDGCSSAEKAGFLDALHVRGETAAEMAGFARHLTSPSPSGRRLKMLRDAPWWNFAAPGETVPGI